MTWLVLAIATTTVGCAGSQADRTEDEEALASSAAVRGCFSGTDMMKRPDSDGWKLDGQDYHSFRSFYTVSHRARGDRYVGLMVERYGGGQSMVPGGMWSFCSAGNRIYVTQEGLRFMRRKNHGRHLAPIVSTEYYVR